MANTSSAIWDQVSVNVTNGASVSNAVGSIFIPPATESFTYDADGNLTSDGRWNYTWDVAGRYRLSQHGELDWSANKFAVEFPA